MVNFYDISGLCQEFKSIIEQIDNSIGRIRSERDWEYSDSNELDDYIKNGFTEGDFICLYITYNSAKQEFSDIKKEFKSKIDLTNLPEYDIKNIRKNRIELGDFIAYLNIIKIQSNKAIGFLEKIMIPITDKERNKLQDLEDELSKYYPEIQEDYERNIKKAIVSYKEGHILASTLISSRVIIFTLDKFFNHMKKIKGELKEENKTDQIIDYILENKLIDKHDETRTYLIRIMRLARNRYSHNIKEYPDSGDPLSLLDGCLKFIKILSKMKKMCK